MVVAAHRDDFALVGTHYRAGAGNGFGAVYLHFVLGKACQ